MKKITTLIVTALVAYAARPAAAPDRNRTRRLRTRWRDPLPSRRISDGDTIKVLIDGKEQSVRLADIDCPETRGGGGQPFGKRAKQFTSSLCFRQTVQVVQTGKHFDRIIAYVLLPNGELLQHELLRGAGKGARGAGKGARSLIGGLGRIRWVE